jgi:2-iminobutanoate/2-iminopropanoate deaminase
VKRAIAVPDAPKAIGPYSPALRAGQWLFLSGQVPFDPATGQLIEGNITDQTRRVLRNIGSLLGAAGLGFDAVARTTVFLADMGDFAEMNAAYAEFFSEPYPARSTVHRDLASLGVTGSHRPERSTSSTPSTPRNDDITFSRCLRSLIWMVTSMRAP